MSTYGMSNRQLSDHDRSNRLFELLEDAGPNAVPVLDAAYMVAVWADDSEAHWHYRSDLLDAVHNTGTDWGRQYAAHLVERAQAMLDQASAVVVASDILDAIDSGQPPPVVLPVADAYLTAAGAF